MIHTLFSRRTAYLLHCGVASAAMLFGSAALAQATGTAAQPKDPNKEPQTEAVDQQAAGGVANISSEKPVHDKDEIVVTGTLVRGAPPVGQNVISVGQERVQSSGAQTPNELLGTIPQVTNLFNNVPASRLNIAVNQIQIVRPNLRNLAPETGSAASTLVLFDGHRIAGAGVTQSSVDPDLIPTGAIERVEVVTDGGSATYGADAVGGVINFITRKRFDGISVNARYGFAKDYYQVDGTVIAGKDWGSGSIYAAYSYQHNDAIFGRDRDFVRAIDWNTMVPTGRSCNPGNVVLGGVTYPLPSLNAAAGPNVCDSSDDSSFIPRSTRHGAIAALHQELSPAITVDLRAFYGQRGTLGLSPFRGSANVTRTQAFYRPIPANPTGTQSVAFTFAPILGTNSAESISRFKEWGVSPEVTAKLGGKWQLRQLVNYSHSNSFFSIAGLSTALINAAASSPNPQSAINFYDPAATPNLDLIRAAANNIIQAGQARDTLTNLRTILDGTLFELPGGEVKLAVGYEFFHEFFEQRVATNIVPGALSTMPYGHYKRDVHALFGELQVPIVGDGNRMGGIYSLILAGSVRYDHFSDFGSTTNPKVGVIYKPVRWLGLRGNYSTSFNAPTSVDQLGSRANFFQVFPVLAVPPPGTAAPPPGTVQTIVLMGAVADLKPQTAKTWSLGFDIDPPFLAGLHASASYYNVKYKGVLNRPPAQSPAILFSAFSDVVVLNPSAAFLQSLIPLASNGPVTINTALQPGAVPVVEYIDFRLNNFGNLNVEGLDFAANFRRSTSFGGIDASVSGNYQLSRKQQQRAGLPFTDLLAPGSNTSRLQLTASLGVDIGNFRAQATLNHSQGFRLIRSASLPQDRLGDFDTVNLYFKYDVHGESLLLKDLSLTLNVNNLFNTNPPVYKQTGQNGYLATYGVTLGRLMQFGVSKKF
jgi:iron complex outermembrane receptor protein